MALTDKLKDIITQQKETLFNLENEYLKIESNDLMLENDMLTIQLDSIKADSVLDKAKIKSITEENKGLKSALYEQLYSERLAIIHISEKKLDVYFKSNCTKEINRLTALEKKIRKRIDTMTLTLTENNIDISDELFKQLDGLSALLDEKITVAKSELNKLQGSFSQNEKEEFEALKNDQLTTATINESVKKNNLESLIGLNIINKLGILLIVIGVIVASKYSSVYISDYLKGLLLFAFGGALLITGELLNRKKPNIFSLGITAGGVAVLYVSLAASYFSLNILQTVPALLICILITVVAFLLSTRYNAQVILAFALVGSYLPMFLFGERTDLIYPSMIYFIILNLLSISISFNKKWITTTFLGLFLNIMGTSYIILLIVSTGNNDIAKVLTILYQLFVFFTYTLIPIIASYKLNLKLKKSDHILFVINTFFSSIIMYLSFHYFNFDDFLGLFAIIFAVSYLLLGRILELKLNNEITACKIFFQTGFAFVVLIIPFQFTETWLSLGWLVEGVVIAGYGILHNEKTFKKAGLILAGLCLAVFFIFDIPNASDSLFTYKYIAITLGNLAILGCLIYKKTLSGEYEKIYKYISLLNLWIFINYIINVELYATLQDFAYDYTYICSAFAIVLGLLLAYCLPRIPLICDQGVKILSGGIYIADIIYLTALNTFVSPLPLNASISQMVLGSLILFIVSVLVMLALYDLIRFMVFEGWLPIQLLPIILSAYALCVLSQNLILHYDVAFSSMLLSICYVLTALFCIILGFYKRYPSLRRFGLGLSILAVLKLFLIDLVGLTQVQQIISYFALGITLLGISFVYQYFNKRLELKLEETSSVD